MTRRDACIRCGRPIVDEGRPCPQSPQRWPCVSPDDPTVIEAAVGGVLLRMKTGRSHVRPVPILDDPYRK